jgi:hypothetical protein
MQILMLAPHPFYQERGTPIDVDLVLRVLSERGDRVDVVTYHEGSGIDYRSVTLHRIAAPYLPREIGPGFSWKKVVCDFFLGIEAFRLCRRNPYHLVHAVEESVFIALTLKWLFKVPYVYDMDSSLAQQMVEKYSYLSPLRSIFEYFERMAVKNAKAVIPVCDALADAIEPYGPEKVLVLRDISLLEGIGSPARGSEAA